MVVEAGFRVVGVFVDEEDLVGDIVEGGAFSEAGAKLAA